MSSKSSPAMLGVALAVLTLGLLPAPSRALEIEFDFTFDENGFFDSSTTEGAAARTALEAVGQRYSEIITTSLGGASIDSSNNARIGFTNPSTGQSIQISGASSAATDPLASGQNGSVADVYAATTFAADTLTIFAGAGPNIGFGIGGTGTGLNFTSTFTDDNSHLNRGFRAPGESGLPEVPGAPLNLPVWGGFVGFGSTVNWHFEVDTAASSGETDFYTIALHEVGHVLGLSLTFDDFSDNVVGDQFVGANAVAAANADNGTSLTDLDLVSTTDFHFADNNPLISNGAQIPADPDAIQSFIFAGGNPNLAGTVGLGVLQDTLLEPVANTNPANNLSRFELTNVDVGALEDIGWTAVDPVVAALAGDFNNDSTVDAADYVLFRDTVGTPSAVGTFEEFASNFGASTGGGVASSGVSVVPEPGTGLLSIVAVGMLTIRRRSAIC